MQTSYIYVAFWKFIIRPQYHLFLIFLQWMELYILLELSPRSKNMAVWSKSWLYIHTPTILKSLTAVATSRL